MGLRSCGSRSPPRSPGSSSSRSSSPRTHFALFQKYRCGTSSRAGPPCSGSSGSSSYANAIQALPPRHVLERQVGRVAAVADHAVTYSALVSTPSSSVSSETPVQTVSSFDHFVTQWMSTVTVSLGSAGTRPRSTRPARRPRRGSTKLHSSSGVCGVGPAESTGKSSVTYWPGGTRAGSTDERRRPRKPRETGDITPVPDEPRLGGQAGALRPRQRHRPADP